jgi:hypothetical protein
MKLARLPVRRGDHLEELCIRETLLGAFRLISALCANGFRPTQFALLSSVDHIVQTIEYKLVAADVTPTECLIKILKGNPQGYAKISGDDTTLIRKFTALAAESKAPRFLRFLGGLTGPNHSPILHTQTLILQSITENKNAQLLFAGEAGRKERAELIGADDLTNHPRGLLAYHIELMDLIARCTAGEAPTPEFLARGLVPMSELLQHLACGSELPPRLRSHYLRVLDEAYLDVKRPVREIGMTPEMMAVIRTLTQHLVGFTDGVLPSLSDDYVENLDEAQEVSFAMKSIMDSMALFFARHYKHQHASSDEFASTTTERFAKAVLELRDAVEADDCIVTNLPPLVSLGACLRAMSAAGVKVSSEETESFELARAKLGVSFGGSASDDTHVHEASGSKRWKMTRYLAALSVPSMKVIPIRRASLFGRSTSVAEASVPSSSLERSASPEPELAPAPSFQSLAWRSPKQRRSSSPVGLDPDDSREHFTPVSVLKAAASSQHLSRQEHRDHSTPTSLLEATSNSAVSQSSKTLRSEKHGSSISSKLRSFRKGAAPSASYHPQANLRGFLEVYARKANIQGEFESLAHIFTIGLDADESSSAGATRHGLMGGHCHPVQNLVRQLSARSGGKLDVDAAVTSVRILCACLKEGSSASALASRQRTLRDFGACAVAVQLVTCEEPRLFACGLQLGTALVRGGNRDVQSSFFELVCTLDHTGVGALDASPWSFFERVRDALRLAIKEVPERRTFLSSQAESRRQFAMYSEGMSTSTVEFLRNDLREARGFTTRAHPELLLAFLKELCEGHYVEMQDAMHNQPYTEFDIHTEFEIFKLMEALEPLLDAGNVGQMLQACAALTEMLQGNTSGLITQALLDTKLLALTDRLLIKQRELDAPELPDKSMKRPSKARRASGTAAGGADLVVGVGVRSGDNEGASSHALAMSPRQLLELREAVLTLLHALLEHSDQGPNSTFSTVLDHMRGMLDLPSLAQLAGQWYDVHGERAMRGKPQVGAGGPAKQQAAAEKDGESSQLAMTAGFQAILLLRKITDHSPSLRQRTFSCLSTAARSHYERYVGRVEICNAQGLLERVYFRKPMHYHLPAETKQAIVWGVDRDTPGMAEQQFLMKVPDIHLEVMWREVARSSRVWTMIMRIEGIATILSTALAILQNLLIVVDGSAKFNDGTSGGSGSSGSSSSGQRMMRMRELRPVGVSAEELTTDPLAAASGVALAYLHPAAWVQAYQVIRISLGVCQILTCSLAVLAHFGRVSAVKLLKLAMASFRRTANAAGMSGKREQSGSEGATVAELLRHVSHPIRRPLAALRFLSLAAWVSVTDGELLIRAGFVVFAGIGLGVEERFFVIHLVQVVLANKGLMDVLRAVTQNGRQLMLTLYLLVIVIWFFAVWCVLSELENDRVHHCSGFLRPSTPNPSSRR